MCWMLVTFALSSLLASGAHIGEDVAPVTSNDDVDKMVADMTKLTPDEMAEATNRDAMTEDVPQKKGSAATGAAAAATAAAAPAAAASVVATPHKNLKAASTATGGGLAEGRATTQSNLKGKDHSRPSKQVIRSRNEILPKPTNETVDPLDIAVVMTQPCSEGAEVPSVGPAGQLQAPGACRGSFADQVKKELEPNNTISPLERIKPVEDMTDNEKTAVKALHGQIIGDMEDVANKTMKATMAKQIAEKVQCIADAKAKKLENLKIQLAPSPVLQLKQNVEVRAERAVLQEREVLKTTQAAVAAKVDRMECLRKAAVKAEKVIEAEAEVEQSKVCVMEKQAATARSAMDLCARRTASESAVVRKEAAVLGAEVAKTQAVVLQAQLEAQTAEREVEQLKEDTDEPIACAPDTAGAVFDAVAALTGDPELAKSITQGDGNKSCDKSLPDIGASKSSGFANPSSDVVAASKEAFMKDNWGDSAAPSEPEGTTPDGGAVPSEPQGITLNGGAVPPTGQGITVNGGAVPPTPQGITLNGVAAQTSLSDLGGATTGAKKVHRELAANAEQQWVQKGTGCPDRSLEKCLNKNQMYSSLTEAWDACGQVDECGKILKYEEKQYYLRRSTDPVVGTGQTLAYDSTTSGSASASPTIPRAITSLLMTDGNQLSGPV
jgi:hypothetical protein